MWKTADTGAVSDAEVTWKRKATTGRITEQDVPGKSGECRHEISGSSSKPRCSGGNAGTSEREIMMKMRRE